MHFPAPDTGVFNDQALLTIDDSEQQPPRSPFNEDLSIFGDILDWMLALETRKEVEEEAAKTDSAVTDPHTN
ncbi:hypothetical protein IL306_001475 [Fusarium sp. DS 682]|nr:hypothetical protein IL306_001475 [Fusarium sp. DS 682]